jgi:hypothetical protein
MSRSNSLSSLVVSRVNSSCSREDEQVKERLNKITNLVNNLHNLLLIRYQMIKLIECSYSQGFPLNPHQQQERGDHD